MIRRQGRDEHPSHLYNTLGTAHARYAEMLEEAGGRVKLANDNWDAARDAFQKSIDLLPGSNVDALLAFGERLLRHAAASKLDQRLHETSFAADVTYALNLIDEAAEALEQHMSPDP